MHAVPFSSSSVFQAEQCLATFLAEIKSTPSFNTSPITQYIISACAETRLIWSVLSIFLTLYLVFLFHEWWIDDTNTKIVSFEWLYEILSHSSFLTSAVSSSSSSSSSPFTTPEAAAAVSTTSANQPLTVAVSSSNDLALSPAFLGLILGHLSSANKGFFSCAC